MKISGGGDKWVWELYQSPFMYTIDSTQDLNKEGEEVFWLGFGGRMHIHPKNSMCSLSWKSFLCELE